MADKLCARTDMGAREIAKLLLGSGAVSYWSIYREDGTDRITVCRNLHAIEGSEEVEYLDEIDPAEARLTEARNRNVTRRTMLDLACVRLGTMPSTAQIYAEDAMR